MNSLETELQWLPRAPREFSRRSKAIGNLTDQPDTEPEAAPMKVVVRGLAERESAFA